MNSAPAAPAPVPVVLVAAGVELARRSWFLLGCFLLHPRTPALVARVLMVLPRAIAYALVVCFLPYAIRGFFLVVVESSAWFETIGRIVDDVVAYGLPL